MLAEPIRKKQTEVSNDQLQNQVLELCRADSNIMVQYIFDYKNAPMHKSWHKFIDTHQYGELLSFRDSGKTENVAIGRTLWEIGNNPNVRIKIATESEDLGTKILSRISATVLKNAKYKQVFPNIKKSSIGSWSRTSITVDRTVDHKDPTVEAAGVLTAATGGRADIIFFDDIAGMRNTLYYPRMREQVKESFYSNWMNMLDGPKGRWYLTGTPWHIKDIVSELRANNSIPKSKEIAIPDTFESPWPERFPSEYFKEKLKLIGRKHYNRAYRLIPLDEEEAWITAGAIDLCKDFNLKHQDICDNKEIPKFTGVDLGHRSGPESSPTVVFTIALLPNGKRVPCDIKISREASPLEIGRVIINTAAELKPVRIKVENVGAQQYLIDLVKTLGPGDFDIKGHHTSSQKFDPTLGVPGLLAEIENGKWIIPLGSGGDHDDTCQCVYCYWQRELMDFPLGSYDTVMACWLALQGLREIKETANAGGNFSLWSWGSNA